MTIDGDLDLLFGALANATRRRIVVALLERQPMTTKQLAARFPLTRWAVMKHLDVLRGAGLVQTLPQQRRRLHFVDPIRLAVVRDWLKAQTEMVPSSGRGSGARLG